MLVGLVTLVTLFVTRFPSSTPPLPERITLPDGTTPTAFTRGAGWLAVVTDADEILIYDPDGTTLRQRIRIDAD